MEIHESPRAFHQVERACLTGKRSFTDPLLIPPPPSFYILFANRLSSLYFLPLFPPSLPVFSLLRFSSQHSTISPTLFLSSVLPPTLLSPWILTFLSTVCFYHLFHRMTYKSPFSLSVSLLIGSISLN